MSQEQKPTVLVTGASGHLGRRVMELLVTAKAGTIIAGTRTPEKLRDLAKQDIIVRAVDFDVADSLVDAFADVDRLLLISTDVVGEPGRRLKQHINAVNAAEKANVKHVIYTSLTNPRDTPVKLAPDHTGTEDALEASKMGWTILRNNIYADSQIASLQRAIQAGKLFKAAGDGKTAYVTREDCARIAAVTLADNFEGRRILDVTGPQALSQADIVKIVSEISGQEVAYLPLELSVLIANLEKTGIPHPVAQLISSFDDGIAQGKFDVVSTVIEDYTGQKPISFADFLSEHREQLLTQAENH